MFGALEFLAFQISVKRRIGVAVVKEQTDVRAENLSAFFGRHIDGDVDFPAFFALRIIFTGLVNFKVKLVNGKFHSEFAHKTCDYVFRKACGNAFHRERSRVAFDDIQAADKRHDVKACRFFDSSRIFVARRKTVVRHDKFAVIHCGLNRFDKPCVNDVARCRARTFAADNFHYAGDFGDFRRDKVFQNLIKVDIGDHRFAAAESGHIGIKRVVRADVVKTEIGPVVAFLIFSVQFDDCTGFLVIFKVDFRTQFEVEADLERFENLNSIGFFINFRAGNAFKSFGNCAANGAVDVFDAVLLFCNVEIYVKVGTERREAVILPVRFDKFGHGIFDFVCEVRRFGKPAYAKFHRLVDAAFRADDVQSKFLETVVADIRDKRRVKRLFARQNIADKEVDDAFDNVGLSAQQAVDDVADLFKQGLIRENRVEFRGHHEIDRTVGVRYRVTAAFGNKGKQDIEQREFIVAVRSQNGGNKVFNACVVNKAAKVVIRQHFFDFQLVENILEKPHYVCDIRIGHVVTMHRLARFIVVEVDIHIAALCVNAKDNRRKVGAFFQHFKGHYAFVDGILFVIASAESVDGTFDSDGVFIRLAFLFDVNVRCERERYVP